MAYTNSRFRTKNITLNDNTNGVKITPALFSSDFSPATSYRFKSVTFNNLVTGTTLAIKGDVADDWVDFTSKLAGESQFTLDFINSFYLKSNNTSAKIGIIALIADSKQS